MTKFILIIVSFSTILFAESLILSGTLISDNEKMITSRFMGFVTQVNISEGEQVKKGQALYSIDSREIDSAARQAELSLQMYQNQYTNVKLNLERHKRLLKKDMVSKYEVENIELAAKNLEDMISIAQARLHEVKNQYKYLHITAPNDGVIVVKNIKVGEMAMPGMPAIVLSDLNQLKVAIEVAESELKRISYGKKVKVKIPSMELELEGKINAIIPSSNAMTHSFKVKISIDTQKHHLYPGMYATVEVD
ncbi:MAG: efflux RND transporter periplasmic adaptor subunit [Sulfurovum sp.]|uniref:efflux RND transporter periplasmic adaptor subunit n=1 Tax=Sulfurovum sp. TaxID=1969726 RepID=UPI002868049C|nr:efflux RND transporter periplasmic adaptor subunit [Sulfurovum sp.]MCO4846302.1 efflux RND transporter periplasmic adaptor subunit [Sulfurovum sp.]